MTVALSGIAQRGFDTAEFARRCALAQAVMATLNLGAVLLASEAEMRYFTGFMTQFWHTPTRPWFVCLPATGAPVAVTPTLGLPVLRAGYVSTGTRGASPDAGE